MYTSESSNRSTSKSLKACFLFCLLLVFSLSVASAQDYRAVAKRLKRAVKNGEITQQQADAMMAVLKRTTDAKTDDPDEIPSRNRRSEWDAIEKRIEDAVERGDITREKADARLRDLRERMSKDKQQSERNSKSITREEFARAVVELRKAVQEGEISGKEARNRLAAMRKMIGQQNERGARGGDRKRRKFDLEAVKKRIDDAVERGLISREQADAKYRELREYIGRERERGDTNDRNRQDDENPTSVDAD